MPRWIDAAQAKERYGVVLTDDNLDPHAKDYVQSKLTAGLMRVWLDDGVASIAERQQAAAQDEYDRRMLKKIGDEYDSDRKKRALARRGPP